MVKMKFENVEALIAWQNGAHELLKGKVVEVGFIHRSTCTNVVDKRFGGADQTCPCRPRPVIAYS